MTIAEDQLKQIVEAALLAASEPLSLDRLMQLFEEKDKPERKLLKEIIVKLAEDCAHRGIEIKEVANGFRYQVKKDLAPWIQKLWEERPGRYSRALMETLALIAYKQPITRADVEAVRGVAVSPNIIRTLQEREWIHIAGHKEVPGRPALFVTTKRFLDDFNIKNLQELPTLADVADLDEIEKKFEKQLQLVVEPAQTAADENAADHEDTQATT